MLGQLVQVSCKPVHVGVIQRRLNLVKETEGRRFQIQNREQKRDGGQRLLSAGELHHILQLFARRLGNDADARLQNIHAFFDLQRRMSAAEHFLEDRVEFPADLLKLLLKLLPHAGVQLLDDPKERGLCRFQVAVLLFHEGAALRDLFILVDGAHVHIAQGADLLPQTGSCLPHGGGAPQLRIPVPLRLAVAEAVLVLDILRLVADLLRQSLLLVLQTDEVLFQIPYPVVQLFLLRKEGLLPASLLGFFIPACLGDGPVFFQLLPEAFQLCLERLDFLPGCLHPVLCAAALVFQL